MCFSTDIRADITKVIVKYKYFRKKIFGSIGKMKQLAVARI
jgi:hypothetical protein